MTFGIQTFVVMTFGMPVLGVIFGIQMFEVMTFSIQRLQ